MLWAPYRDGAPAFIPWRTLEDASRSVLLARIEKNYHGVRILELEGQS